MLKAGLLILVAAIAFGASFYVADTVQAHGTHCATYGGLGCAHYYAGQTRCCASGIQARIKAQNVVLPSPSTDFTAHWVGLTSITYTGEEDQEWVQMGFSEGIDPFDEDIAYTPELYTEYRRTSCGGESYHFQYLGTPGGLWDQMFIEFNGEYYSCSGVIQYCFDLRQGQYGTVWVEACQGAPYGRYGASSELGNNHAINPNGTQYFGTNSSGWASAAYGIKVCCSGGGQWDLWYSSPSAYGANDPYDWIPQASYWSFRTTGGP